MTRSTVRRLTKPLDEPEREFRRLRRVAWRLHQNESLAIAGRNLFDDEASSSNNTRTKSSTPLKTLQEHSRPNSSGFQILIILSAEQTGKIVDSRDILLIQGTCTFQGLRSEDPLHHIKHYLSIVYSIQADGDTRDTSRPWAHEDDECGQNNPTEQVCLSGGDIYDDPSLLRFYQNNDIPPWGNNKHKEKGEDGPEWVIRNKFEDELAKESKFPKSEAPTFAITNRSRISTRDAPFPTQSQLTPTNHAEGTTKRVGPEGAKSRIMQNEEAPKSSIFYQPSKSLNLPFPSRVKKQKKDDGNERLLSIFKQIHINLPFLKAMIHMPKGAKVLKDLLSHKEKLEKVASSVKLSEECSAIIQRSLPQKEGDPGSFTLSCLIRTLAVKNALADLGASINLIPHFLFRRLGISKLKPTKMILEMDEDELVPIILGRPFLAIARAVIDVHEGKLSLRVRNETITFNYGKSMKSKHSRDDYLYYADHTAKLVREQWSVEPLEWKASENRLKPSSVKPPELELKELPEHLEYTFLQENNQLLVVISPALSTVKKAKLFEVLKNHKGAIAWSITDIKGIDSSFCTHKILMKDEFKPSVQPQRRVNPSIKEVVKKEFIRLLDAGLIYLISDSPWVSLVQVVPKKGGMTVVKNEKNELIPQRTISIAPKDQEKTTFTCPYGTFVYKRVPFGLCNAPATFQRCMTAIFHELIKDSMEVFMDDFSVLGSSFKHCLENLEKMLKRCEETNLMLNWEKCHFIVRKRIVLGHKVSGSGIKVDKAKIEAISKLPYPTNVKAIRSFLGHVGFYRRFIKDFSQVARPMTQL
ncbi:DNA-directed DNA polymerase [Tanacetum coccineum]